MIKLLIDAGNTSLKWALLDTSLDKDRLSDMHSYVYGEKTSSHIVETLFEQQINKQANNQIIDEIIMVSVLGDTFLTIVKKLAKKLKTKLINIQSSEKLAGVTSAYNEPHKLGADRLVAIIAAYHLYPHQISIVVDAGTATTIDAVDFDGQHLGGIILPGLDLCSESLVKNTEMLTCYNKSKQNFEPNIFAKDTKQAIASGSLYGLVGAITHICCTMEKATLHNGNSSNIKKIICGGSAHKLTPYLSNDFTHHNELLMEGLEIISKQNMQTN